MATQTNEQLKTAAGVIKNETVAKANSATRLGTILENMADSLANKSEIPSLASYSTTSQMNSAITAAVNALVNGAPGALDTLNELSDALGDDANFAATVTAALANKQIKPLLSQTYNGEFNLSTGNEVSYKITSINEAHTPTVAANPIENSFARVLIDAGSNFSLVATNLGTKRPESDDPTPSKQNELTVMILPDGTAGALVKYYSIKVLN